MEWSYDLLWNKSKSQAQYAHTLDKNSSLFPFWCALSFETFARGSLAYVHPALLADPMEGDNILYVFGYSISKLPKSIPIKSVLERLTKIVEKFKKSEFEFAMNLMERRNRELHSGAPAFEDFPTKIWLAEYYRIVSILLDFQGKTLNDFLQPEDSSIATKMVEEDIGAIAYKVKELIKHHKAEFYKAFATNEERATKRKDSYSYFIFSPHRKYTQEVICPACKAKAMVYGEISRTNEPTLEGEKIIRQVSAVPTEFECVCCNLKLTSYAQLQVADFGGYIIVQESYDPMEYYDFDPMDYYEPDYGND
jgi:hypothetical protein